MKKILLLTSIVLGLTSCNLDVNTDPNYPSEVSPSLLLPSAQNFIAATVGDGMYNYAGFFSQYFDQMPEANQYNQIAEYDFTESDQIIDRSYRNLYAGALMDLNKVLQHEESTSGDKYAATILRAFCFQLLVDNMDKTPYAESLLGSSNSMPVWDNGKDVYTGILQEMDAAEEALGSSTMSSNDLLLGKNLNQWKGFANALRLRMYLRFIDANEDAAGYTAKLKTLIDAGEFFTGDIKYDVFTDETNKRNPWYATNKVKLANNHVAGYAITTYLTSTSDPRISYNFVKAANSGSYAGELPGSKQVLASKKNADYSALNYYATKPVYFFTQSELQFLLAESYLRFYNDATRAKTAYEAGIDADFAARNLSNASQMYGTGGTVAWSSVTTQAAQLELIYMQKWVALCYMDHMEAWSEIRRTDCPKWSAKTASEINADPTIYTAGDLIKPMRNGLGTGVVKRMFFPLSARQLNKNTPAAVEITTPVWWDVK